MRRDRRCCSIVHEIYEKARTFFGITIISFYFNINFTFIGCFVCEMLILCFILKLIDYLFFISGAWFKFKKSFSTCHEKIKLKNIIFAF